MMFSITARDFIAFMLIVILLGMGFFIAGPLEHLATYIGENYFVSAMVFILLMFVATVVAPIAVLPLLPATAPLLGPWQTALLAVVGWTLGAIVAFYISRYGGLPLLRKFMHEDRLNQITTLIPERSAFWWVLFLRMLIPVDVLSYALGLITTVRPVTYIIATLIGVTPFAFIFAYGGVLFLEREYDKLIGLIGLGLFIFLTGILIVRRKHQSYVHR